jgi:hypothetical protein
MDRYPQMEMSFVVQAYTDRKKAKAEEVEFVANIEASGTRVTPGNWYAVLTKRVNGKMQIIGVEERPGTPIFPMGEAKPTTTRPSSTNSRIISERARSLSSTTSTVALAAL